MGREGLGDAECGGEEGKKTASAAKGARDPRECEGEGGVRHRCGDGDGGGDGRRRREREEESFLLRWGWRLVTEEVTDDCSARQI